MKTPKIRKTPKTRRTPRHLAAEVKDLRHDLEEARRTIKLLCQPVPAEPPKNILQKAEAAVYGSREENYSHPTINFARIARRWTAALHGVLEYGAVITPEHVMECNIQQKLARLESTPDHEDSLVDIAGYAATGARLQEIDA